MSKGKGKEAEVEADPIELSDTDSDVDFFTVKRRAPPVRVRAPSPAYISSGGDDDDEASGKGKKKTKRRRTKPAPKPTLPDWTRRPRRRAGSDERSGRGASTQASDIVTVSSDEGEPAPSRSRPERRPRVKLTPPPEISDERRAELAAALDARFEQAVHAAEVVDDSPERPRPPPARSSDPAHNVQVTVRMVADPDRSDLASENAIRGYERARVINVNRNEPVSALIKVVADRIKKLPEEILFTYNGRRIFATSQTLLQLGIFESGHEISGYERRIWDSIERKRKEEQARLFGGESSLGGASDEGTLRVASGSPDHATAAPAAPAVDEGQRVRIMVRGTKGEIRFATKVTTLASTIIKYYCKKSEIDETGLSMYWDGEVVPPDTSLEAIEVENGDIVEIR
ncbi:hypothetical protein Q8F55_001311 [Vanrija albida]|uniref:Rad60/SUMO-like domain-containing protein n=1 Tax=Vanrija albida TaxID=181172 RepID=A0ABR3QG58_9TREE